MRKVNLRVLLGSLGTYRDEVEVDHEREEERGGVGSIEEGREEAGIKNEE